MKKSKRKKSRRRSRRKNVGDIISELGDDILLSIINRLTFKEATATSVLSTRWRPLHTRISRLNFPFRFPGGDCNYVKMINHTLDSYEGEQGLKEFRLDSVHYLMGLDVNRLLEFSLAREAEIIHIRLANSIYTRCGLKLEKLISNSLQTIPGLKCLRELSLSRVDADDIKFLLSNSPNLESLSLEYSYMLRNVSIVGHPKLQHVRISCFRVEFIEIENVINLVSLSFYGLPHYGLLPDACVVRVNNVPKLIEFNADKQACAKLLFKFSSSIRSQLLLVRLKLESFDSFPVGSLPELINVKHLEVQWNYQSILQILPVIRLIEACRSLEKFEMKVAHSVYIFGNVAYWDPFLGRNRGVKKCSPHLKEVKLLEYLGSPIETQFAAIVVKYAASSLQEFVVQRRYESSKSARCIAIGNANVRSRFRPITPKTANLVVI